MLAMYHAKVSARVWSSGLSIALLMSLSAIQSVADVVATQRWADYEVTTLECARPCPLGADSLYGLRVRGQSLGANEDWMGYAVHVDCIFTRRSGQRDDCAADRH
jgi:hypothetical protein